MSSVTVGAWRRPQYVVTALTALLQNEVLHDGLVHTAEQPVQAHGPGSHSDRQIDLLVPAGVFGGGTLTTLSTAPLPVITLTDAQDITLRGAYEIPPGIVSLDGAVIAAIQVGSSSGDVLVGIDIRSVAGGDSLGIPPFPSPAVAAVTLALAGSNDEFELIAVPTLGGGVDLADDILAVSVRRNAASVLDTLDAILYFVGVILTVTLDQ